MIANIEHSCGHRGDREIRDSYGHANIGPRTQSNGIAYWKARECVDCWKANKQADTASKLEQIGWLPVLNGFERQVAWATQIRARQLVNVLEKLVELQDANNATKTPELIEVVGEEFFVRANNSLQQKFDILKLVQDAKFWMDTQHAAPEMFLGAPHIVGTDHYITFNLDEGLLNFWQRGRRKEVFYRDPRSERNAWSWNEHPYRGIGTVQYYADNQLASKERA
mgnify:CR=1 FL=1